MDFETAAFAHDIRAARQAGQDVAPIIEQAISDIAGRPRVRRSGLWGRDEAMDYLRGVWTNEQLGELPEGLIASDPEIEGISMGG